MYLTNIREFLFVTIFICIVFNDVPFVSPIPPTRIDLCVKGPSYWCADAKNARECGIQSDICQKYNKHLCKTKKINCESPSTIEPVGSNPCTWGPSYWCASAANAQKCGLTEADCEKYGGIKNESETPLPGSNPCTWGPSYWCASVENAKKCGLTESECDKYGGIKNNAAATTP